jgi:hypothetical protein
VLPVVAVVVVLLVMVQERRLLTAALEALAAHETAVLGAEATPLRTVVEAVEVIPVAVVAV